MPPAFDLGSVGGRFEIDGEFESAEPFGNGHINDTFLATYRRAGEAERFIHQRINRGVFRDPPALMENVRRVLAHLRAKQSGEPDLARRVLTLIPAKDGRAFAVDGGGDYWRTYLYIGGGRTYEVVEHPRQAYESGKAFGRFQSLLADLPGPRLHDTIPHFHDTPRRLAALEEAVAADSANRAKLAKPEIDFVLRRKPWAGVLQELLRRGEVPERITHNDTKFNNVVIDDSTREALCVVDMDTVMPGLALHDFGDMIRTATSPAAEDERDLSKVEMRMPMFEALVQGYLSSAGDFLNETEKKHLPFSGKVVTLEVGMRFLADYLAGDVYFKIHREGHNLDRCRTQFALVEAIEREEERMSRAAESLAGAWK